MTSDWAERSHLGRPALAVLAVLASACGGGSPPPELATARVVVHEATVSQELVYENQSLGLIQGLYQPRGSEQIAIFGFTGRCMLTLATMPATCDKAPAGLVPPVSIGTFVSGNYIAADFDGDGTSERIVPVEKAGFALQTEGGVMLARTSLERYWVGTDFQYWFEPAVTWSDPRLLLVSARGTLLLFDNHLAEVRQLPAPTMQSPLHVLTGAPLDAAWSGPFASVFTGRGGWHRSILFIHTAANRIVFEQILDDDVGAVWPLPADKGQYRFLLGGRGQVWRYTVTPPA